MTCARRALPLLAVAVSAVTSLAGCGGSAPRPLAPQALVSDLLTQSPGYATVLVIHGHGSRRFTGTWPRRIAVQMSCRGASTVSFAAGRDVLVKVGCAAGQAGGGTTRIGHVSTVSVIAPAGARWSLVVGGRSG